MRQVRLIFFLIVAAVACKEIYDPPPQSLVEVTVKYSDEKQTGSPKISVYGIGADSILVYQERTNLIRLPLSREDSSMFVFLFDSIPDTLTIFHTNKMNYESMESGFFYTYWIDDIEHSWNRIDSLIFKDSVVNQIWHENIKLYIHNLPSNTN